MISKKFPDSSKKHCNLPRRHDAVEALILLSWKKSKNEIPNWLSKELKVLNKYQKLNS